MFGWHGSPSRTHMTWCHLRWCVRQIQQYRSKSSHERFNAVGIQMLTDSLHKQIFSNNMPRATVEYVQIINEHLKKHGLSGKETNQIPDIDIKLPNLFGGDVNEHFAHIAKQQLSGYQPLMEGLACVESLPTRPEQWNMESGWTKYSADGTAEMVPFPDDPGLVFDVEVLMAEGNFPTMATAVSRSHWYSWVSQNVIADSFHWQEGPQLKNLIPLEPFPGKKCSDNGKWLPRLIIGHNVGFDRSFVKEQYITQGTSLRFLDTMSMHIAICGQTSFQRILHRASKKESSRKEVLEHAERQKLFRTASSEEWKKISGMNNLRDVHQLHCGGNPIEKVKRDVFVDGIMDDVRSDFQDLMTYCSNDVIATHQVFVKLWPQFKDRFPHPVTLAGMLEMGSAYLPINESWPRYLHQANYTYEEMERELKKLLMDLANDACRLMESERYKDDPWLWDLDWSTKEFKLKKQPTPKRMESTESLIEKDEEQGNEDDYNFWSWMQATQGEDAVEKHKRIVENVYATATRLPKNPTFMAGYPSWFKDLCPRAHDEDFYPGPSKISTQCRVTPKLMRLTWDGFPVHYHDKCGWGYLVPHLDDLSEVERELRSHDPDGPPKHPFPLKSFLAFLRKTKPSALGSILNPEEMLERGKTLMGDPLGSGFDEKAMEMEEKVGHWDSAIKNKKKKTKDLSGVGPYNIDIPGVRFFKIPHKEGGQNRVGNPLARDYLLRVEDGTLQASTGMHAKQVLLLGRMCSYWKQNHKRIGGQMTVQLGKPELDRNITRSADFVPDGLYGAIIPRIVSAGTITRRAVEPTWLTASNAYADRIGSELKSMIQAPPGYHFVGADVDSQELWIASVLGDAYFMQQHGCTALGWMTLQGNKGDKTDLHSKTAEIASVSRDHAKVINYGRIYGAGQTFAERLLMQFNPQLSASEAKRKAATMYKQTKGQRNSQRQWIGGTESFMFNALEAIANSEEPVTPVLGCRMSKALEPRFVLDDFLTSRVNWVVQSSAVDYLHLMLVCMRWLITTYNLQGRFCVSIHDEVRYLFASKDRYRAALALQITNLLTRCMFSHRLGMDDLPQSVAFFSAVDIDVCLRKEVTYDCKTPSNPHGLQKGYGMPPGEALNIEQVMSITKGKI